MLFSRNTPPSLSPSESKSLFCTSVSGWGIHVNPWLIHVNVWQKPLQYGKVISLQLIMKKINKLIKKKKNSTANAGAMRLKVWSLGREDALEKGTTTHSSILAWRTPWTEEPEAYKASDPTQVTYHDFDILNESCLCDDCVSCCIVSDSSRPHELWPSRLLCPGILQASTLEWVAISSSRGSSWSRDLTQAPRIAGRFFTLWARREAPCNDYPA